MQRVARQLARLVAVRQQQLQPQFRGVLVSAGATDKEHQQQHVVRPIGLDELLQHDRLPTGTLPDGPSAASAAAAAAAAMNEQQLTQLFDAELEQRLLAAAAAATAPQQQQHTAQLSGQAAALAPATQQEEEAAQQLQQQQEEALQQRHWQQPSVTRLERGSPVYEQPELHQPPAAPGQPRVASWQPAAAADPWAPLPGPAAARQRLPSQLLQLLQEAGVPVAAAAAALRRAATDLPTTTSSSSSGSPPSAGRRRAAQRKQPQQRPQQQQQQPDYLAVLRRLQPKQLVSLLDECQAPTYGQKQELVRRIALLLQEQQLLRQQQLQQQAGPALEGPTAEEELAAAVAGSNAGDTTAVLAASPQQEQQLDSPRRSRVLAAAAARQAVLGAVLDVRQVCSWLMAARAQDVCCVDVRGRAGLQQQLVIATGLSQQHAHACAEAVAWQLREAARQHLQQQGAAAAGQDEPLPVAVLGDPGADWAVVDAGRVVVHVLTARARHFYNLEGLWGGRRGEHVLFVQPETVVETKDTIGRR